MEFKEFKDVIKIHFDEMTKDVSHLFEVAIDKDVMWNTYLDSFPPETNKIFKERREYDCSCCRQFIRAIGNAVVIKDNIVHTIWDVNVPDETYQTVANAMSAFIKSHVVTDVYFSESKKVGTDFNLETMANGKIIQWDHFYLELPDKFVNRSHRSIGDIQGTYRDTRNVFKRSLDEITEEAVLTLLELISQNSLYKGEEWKSTLTEFNKYQKEYNKLDESLKENYAWEKSLTAGIVIGRIGNHSIVNAHSIEECLSKWK